MFYNLVSFTHHVVGGINKVSYTYDVIDDNGNTKEQNVRATISIVPTADNKDVIDAIGIVEQYLKGKLPVV